jgi:5-methyltetrahydropteroyltriglutamate--homocysteine methyltransferase
MRRSEDRILTTHVGSLPRPKALTSLYARRVRGEAVDLKTIEDAAEVAVAEVIRRQIDCGIDIINNGEQPRESFVLYLRHRLTGLGGVSLRPMSADIERYPSFKDIFSGRATGKEAVSNRDQLPAAVGEVTYSDPRFVEGECRQFRDALDRVGDNFVEPFLTAPSPGIVSTIVQNRHYETFERYLDALGKALQVEYETIVGSGFILQLDCPDLALERHTAFQDEPLGKFMDFAEAVIATINKALANVPRDRVRLHACWGNYEGPHDCDVPMEEILPTIMEANVGGFVLPLANPRHAHEHRAIAKYPLKDDQVLVAGVIDTVTNFVEHPEVVAERLERISHAVGDPTRVIAGTDCGFDTSAGMGHVAEDVVWAKLRSLAEGARIASGRLF